MIETPEIIDVFAKIKKLSPTQLEQEINSLTDTIRPLIDELELLQLMRSIVTGEEGSSRVKPGGLQRGGFPRGVGGRKPNSEKPTPPPESSANLHKVHSFIEVNGPSIPQKVADATGIPYGTVYAILKDSRYFEKRADGTYALRSKK